MYRRRRAHRDKIQFSFDSFLDVVANVNGIIIRLIIVAWVGARSYQSTMEFHDDPMPEQPRSTAPAPIEVLKPPAPKTEDEPLTPVLAAARADLEKARKLLAEKVVHVDDGSRTIDAI